MPNSTPTNAILIVDDESETLSALERVLKIAGFPAIVTCDDSRQTLALIRRGGITTVILDLHMPHQHGEQLLELILSEQPDLPVIVVTGTNEVETAVRCIKHGAYDFLPKPVDRDRLVMTVRRACQFGDLCQVNRRLSERMLAGLPPTSGEFAGIISADPTMLSMFSYIEAVAPSAQPVLITGETGTGKELVARALHQLSGRQGELVPVNVAGLDDTMFADTLFGHRKGAFTGADENRPGLVEKAKGGTLFLDEIGDLGPTSQVKLLRLIQEHEYLPLGSDAVQRSTARIVAATSRRLKPGNDEHAFRSDLYYRLRAHAVHLPPLRERIGDLRLLVPAFVAQAATELRRIAPEVAEEVYDQLNTRSFPGNIRELRAMIFDAISLCQGYELRLDHFRNLTSEDSGQHRITPRTIGVTFGKRLPTLKEVQNLLVTEVLRRTKNNQAAAAALLGVSRQALNKRLRLGSEPAADGQDSVNPG